MTLEQALERGLASFDAPWSRQTLEDLCFYVMELAKWNKGINLVGLKDEKAVVGELLYDAFFLNSYLRERESVLDLGSGAGIIAIPIKILNREMPLFSVDRTLKKIQFQRHVKRNLKLINFSPIHSRAETLDPLNVQVLVAKAFGSIPHILARGGKHTARGGYAFLLRGKNRERENVEGFVLEDVIPYRLPYSTKERTLFVYRKRG